MKHTGCLIMVSVMVVAGTLGCASKRQEAPQPSNAQIRSDSDRFYEKLKQEERERGSRDLQPR